jgi:hypothetical protein
MPALHLHGQHDRERGPRARRAGREDRAAVLADDLVRDEEAEPMWSPLSFVE